MNIAVIAANGRLGKKFVEVALEAGHVIRAGVRGAHTFAPHPRLEVVSCDATKPEDLKKLFAGQQAVVSAIGHIKGSQPDVQTVATRAIVAVMEELGVNRFVDVTGTGVRFAGDKVTFVDWFLNFGVTLIDHARVQDGRDHQEVLKQSNLNWTTIRVLKLQNVQPKPFSLTLHGPTKWYVGRDEVARAMLQVIEEGTFVKEAPIVSKKRQ